MNRYQRWRLNRRTRQERQVLTAISRPQIDDEFRTKLAGYRRDPSAPLSVLVDLMSAYGLYFDPRPDGKIVWRCRGCHARLRADEAGAPTGVRHMPNCGEPHQHTAEEAT